MDDSSIASIPERAAGVLLGTAAGDKNGGPQRLAFMLCDSVISLEGLDVNRLWQNWYSPWYKLRGFDTGTSFAKVQHYATKINQDAHVAKFDPASCAEDMYKKALKEHSEVPAGIGSAHRNAVLSVFPLFPDSLLPPEDHDTTTNAKPSTVITLREAATEECKLTHYAPICTEVCVSICHLCRYLIQGHSWKKQ